MKDVDQPLDFVVVLQAMCDHCGDHSFAVELKHLFKLSSSDDSVISRIKQENGKTVVYTTKR